MAKLIAALVLVSLTGCGALDIFEAPPAEDKCNNDWIYDKRIKRT